MNLKQLRTASGITQAQLAEQMRVSKRTIERWERGDCEMSHADIVAASRPLGVTVADVATAAIETYRTKPRGKRGRPISQP